jgi:hypothetical protein
MTSDPNCLKPIPVPEKRIPKQTQSAPQEMTDSRSSLVMVFDDFAKADDVVAELVAAGFSAGNLGLLKPDRRARLLPISGEAVPLTIGGYVVGHAVIGGLLGLTAGTAAGIVAGISTPSLALGIGMAAAASITGAIMGGVVGGDSSRNDDRADLPTARDYQRFRREGKTLVVLSGDSSQLERARTVLEQVPPGETGLHSTQGHAFHIHPGRGVLALARGQIRP